MTAPAQGGIQHTALPWGMGLSRDSGAIDANPRQMQDVRNVLFYENSLRLRGGLGAPVAEDFTAAGFTGTDVCHVAVFKAQAQVIYVVFDAVTREVRVFTADLLGHDPVDLGRWGTLNAQADTPPRFLTAEAFGVLLCAHDEPNVSHRLQTMRYDPNQSGPLDLPPFLHLDPTDTRRVAFATFLYTLAGSHTKAAAVQALAGLTIIAGTWGVILLQIDAAGAVTLKVPGAVASYATEPEALAALPAPDVAHIELGHLTVQALGTSAWVAGTNNLTDGVLASNYYDGPQGIWCAIEGDLEGTGLGEIKFRGVREYRGFMLGWGYGTPLDPDRPELLRISAGGDPAVYPADNFIPVGPRGEPLVAAGPVSNACGLLKSVGWYTLEGTDRSNWEVQLRDPFTGCTSARGALSIAGQLWWWSQSGPARSLDGITTDPNWALDLDLTGPEPLDLPAKGAAEAVWVLFLPDERHVLFAHPNAQGTGTRGYLVSARDLGTPTPQWAYWVLAGVQLHAAVINADQVSQIAPGTASAVSSTGASGSAVAMLSVDWTQNDMVGDEVWELWYKAAAGAWVKLKEFTYASVAGPTGSTTFTDAPLVSGAYTVQLRARRGTRYATGYEGGDPTAWPAGSSASGTIVVVALPSAVTASYDYATGNVTVNWTAGDPAEAQDVRLTEALSGTSQVVSVPAGTFTVIIPDGAVSMAARAAGAFVAAEVRHKIGSIVGTYVAATSAPAFWTGADIAGLAISLPSDRQSVASGTDVDIRFTKPAAVVGDWDFELDAGGSLGANPANGGCGASFPSGGGYVFPSVGQSPMFSGTFPDTEPSPVDVLHVPAFSCATCSIVGQVIGMGQYAGWWSFAKAGTLVHRTANSQLAEAIPFNGYLPGSNAGFAAGKVCGA